MVLTASVLLRSKTVVKFSVLHSSLPEELVIHIMIGLNEHYGAHSFNGVVVCFFMELDIGPLKPP